MSISSVVASFSVSYINSMLSCLPFQEETLINYCIRLSIKSLPDFC